MDLPKIKVPLILGIWGGKGQGKTFQVCTECIASSRLTIGSYAWTLFFKGKACNSSHVAGTN